MSWPAILAANIGFASIRCAIDGGEPLNIEKFLRLRSEDPDVSPSQLLDADDQKIAEIERRLMRHEAGSAKLIPMDEAIARMHAAVKK